jgi:hypothetical protein
MNSADFSTESDTKPDPLRGVQMEIDAFCAHCECNLYGEEITRHPRLGIPICRCPSCGRSHPDAYATSASWPAIRKFNAILIVASVALSVFYGFLMLIYLAMTQYAYLDEYTKIVFHGPAGEQVFWTWSAGPNGVQQGYFHKEYAQAASVPATLPSATQPAVIYETPVTNVTAKRMILDHPLVYANNNANPPPRWWEQYMPYAVILFLFGIGGGVFVAITSWHAGRKKWRALLIPIPLGIVVDAGWLIVDPTARTIVGWVITHTIYLIAIEVAVIALGLRMGLPLARLVVKMILPPVPRERLVFLWPAKGKPVPAV